MDTSFYDGSSTLQPSSKFESYATDMYVDVGLAAGLGATLYVAGQRRQVSGEEPSWGLGNMMLGVRYGILVEQWALSLEARTDVPLSDGRTRPLHTNRVWSGQLWAHAGLGFGTSVEQWATLNLGLSVPITFGPSLNRGYIANVLHAEGEYGVKVFDWAMWKSRVAIRYSLGVDDAPQSSGNGLGFFATTPRQQDDVVLSSGFIFPLFLKRKAGIEAQISQVLWGLNRGRSRGLSTGVYASW